MAENCSTAERSGRSTWLLDYENDVVDELESGGVAATRRFRVAKGDTVWSMTLRSKNTTQADMDDDQMYPVTLELRLADNPADALLHVVVGRF